MATMADEARVRYLDPKVKIIWASAIVGLAAVVWLLLTVLSQMAFPEGIFGIPNLLYPLMFFVIVALAIAPYLVWLELRYQYYKYYLTDREILIRKGVIRHERTVIPYDKVQNVNVSRSIFERLLGLATLKIETAGTNPGEAEGLLPGVGHYRELVDEILEQVEHARAPKQKEKPMDPKELLREVVLLKNEVLKLRDENAMLRIHVNQLGKAKYAPRMEKEGAGIEALEKPEPPVEAEKKEENNLEFEKGKGAEQPKPEFEGAEETERKAESVPGFENKAGEPEEKPEAEKAKAETVPEEAKGRDTPETDLEKEEKEARRLRGGGERYKKGRGKGISPKKRAKKKPR